MTSMNLAEYDHVVGSASREFSETGLDIGHFFPWAVLKMNTMYGLPINQAPTLTGLGESPVERMTGFLKTLKAEMDEGQEIMAFLVFRDWVKAGKTPTTEQLMALATKLEIQGKRASDLVALMAEKMQPTIALDSAIEYDDPAAIFHRNVMENIDQQALVMIADWLADMNVYNRSEALKYGIPLEDVLHCVMGSNFTKLNPDGTVNKDANGKVLKGPNFRAPENHIHATLFDRAALQDEYIELHARVEKLSQMSAPVLLSPMDAVFMAMTGSEEHDHEHAIDEDDVEIEEAPARPDRALGSRDVFEM